MQVLEGESELVDELHQKIVKDPRHTGLVTLIRSPIPKRSFSDWKMGFKNISQLTEDEKAAHSDYLDRLLNDTSYIPIRMRLLFY